MYPQTNKKSNKGEDEMKVLDYLQNAKVFYGATVDKEQPRVRPLGFVMSFAGQLCFYVDSRSEMYRQMQSNPKMEICAIDEKMNSLRLTGTVKFITDAASQDAALKALPLLSKLGYTVGSEFFQIYSLENIQLHYTSMAGKPLTGVEL